MSTLQMRTWAEVSLGNIEHNFKQMKARLKPGTRFLGIVKADAYGHGALTVAPLLERLGCDYLGVACIDEAYTLRDNGIGLPILIMGYTPERLTDELIANNFTQTIYSAEMAEGFSRAASSLGQSLKVHLKIDTGMGRLGFTAGRGRDPYDDLMHVLRLPNLDFEGIFTHFPVADCCGDPFTETQYAQFTALVDKLEKSAGMQFEIKHCANGGAMINYDWTYSDMVRPGLPLYGCYTEDDTHGLALRPAMALKTRIAQVKTYEPGDTISYGRTYTVPERQRLAVVTIGYADGLHRALSGKIDMLVRGQRARQVGRICMDMCLIDVTAIPDAQPGDKVTVFGRDGNAFIPVEELASAADTIPYELLCAVSPRVPRVYLD